MIYCHLDNPLLRLLAEDVMKSCKELADFHRLFPAPLTPRQYNRYLYLDLQLKLSVKKYQRMTGAPSKYVNIAESREAEVRKLKHAASHAKHPSTTGKAAPNRTTNQEKLRRKDADSH